MKDIGMLFIEHSKYKYVIETGYLKGESQPPIEAEYDTTKPLIDLPDPRPLALGTLSVKEAIEQRKSRRHYSSQPLSLEELSYLLWCTQGVKEVVRRDDQSTITYRTVPSAGARHAIETYLLINTIAGLTPGIYRYIALQHKLIEITTESGLADKFVEQCRDQKFVKTSAVTFIWVGVIERMKWRFGERGYRYLFIDAGHICQNLYLGAESIGCGVCAIGAFNDDDLNKTLNLDGESQFVIYLGTVGKK